MKSSSFKPRIPLFIRSLAPVLLCLAGCNSPDAANSVHSRSPATHSQPPPASIASAGTTAHSTGEIITTFGEHHIGNTVVEVSESERKFTVKHLSYKNYPAGKNYPGGGQSTSTSAMSTPPDEWPLHDGWFAYVQQNGEYVWLYNGADKILLVERKETPERNFTNIRGLNNLPIPIPAPVLDHLAEPFRSKLTTPR